MKYFFYISCLFFFILSCSSNESVQSFEQIEEADLLLKREILTQIGGEITTADFIYEGNRLTTSTSSDGYSINYTYTSDLLSRLDIIENGSTLIFVEIEYNLGKIESYTAYFIGSFAERFDFTYNSESSILVKRYSGDYTSQEFQNDINVELVGGNITRVTFPDYSLQYQYDTQNSIYKNIFAIDVLNFVGLDFGGFEGIINNPIMRTEEDSGNTETETFTHTYRIDGFPESTDVLLNGAPYGTIKYFYE